MDVFGNDPGASALESGDATPSQAADWALHRVGSQPNALAHIYTMRSECRPWRLP